MFGHAAVGSLARLFSQLSGSDIVLRWRIVYAAIRALAMAPSRCDGWCHLGLQLRANWCGVKKSNGSGACADCNYAIWPIRHELYPDPADPREQFAFHRRLSSEISIQVTAGAL